MVALAPLRPDLARHWRALWPWLAIAAGQAAVVTLGGGDYLFGYRHFVLFSLLILALAGDSLGRAVGSRVEALAVPAQALAILAVTGAMAGPPSAKDRAGLLDAGPNDTKTGVSSILHGKVSKYAAAGRFLERLLPADMHWRVASVEVGTVFFYYGGPRLELVGFSDRRVAAGPRLEGAPAFSPKPNPDVVAQERPEVIWLDAWLPSEDGARGWGEAPEALRRRGTPQKLMATIHTYEILHFPPDLVDRLYDFRLAIVNDLRIYFLVRRDLAPVCDQRLRALGLQERSLARAGFTASGDRYVPDAAKRYLPQ
jgi:hypothetical protein